MATKLQWSLPSSSCEVQKAEASLMFANDKDGAVSVAIRDKVPGPHRDSDGKPILIDVLRLWLTPESLGLLRPATGGGEADFEAIA
jgi:hypothetical protein